MKTLEKYEAKRNIKPTIFRPSWLSEYSKCYTVRTIKDSKRVVTTQRVHTHLFDEIIKMKVESGDIHAVGLIKEKQTFLILRK